MKYKVVGLSTGCENSTLGKLNSPDLVVVFISRAGTRYASMASVETRRVDRRQSHTHSLVKCLLLRDSALYSADWRR